MVTFALLSERFEVDREGELSAAIAALKERVAEKEDYVRQLDELIANPRPLGRKRSNKFYAFLIGKRERSSKVLDGNRLLLRQLTEELDFLNLQRWFKSTGLPAGWSC